MNGCLSPPSATHPLLLRTAGRKSSTPIASSAQPSDSTRRSLLLNLGIFVPVGTVLKQPCFAAEGFDPVTEVDRKASSSIAKRINVAVGLLDKGRELQAKGDFVGALDYFTQVVTDYNDFAFSEYARVGRAFALYEIGDRDEAIAEMERMSLYHSKAIQAFDSDEYENEEDALPHLEMIHRHASILCTACRLERMKELVHHDSVARRKYPIG